MDEFLTVSAEAFVTSKRSDHVSIRNAGIDILSGDVRRFHADPDLVKQVIIALKKVGFHIHTIGKLGVQISGAIRLYEEAFQVNLRQQTAPYVIDTSNSSFKELLDAVVLQRTPQVYGQETPPVIADKPWLINPEEAIQAYNPPKEFSPPQSIHVVVIDSGCFFDHPFLKKYAPEDDGGNSREIVVSERLPAAMGETEKAIEDRFQFIQKNGENLGLTTDKDTELKSLYEKGESLRKVFENKYDATGGHGTGVVASLVPFFNRAGKITLLKEDIKYNNKESAFKQAVDLKPDIIVCSFGTEANIDDGEQYFTMMKSVLPFLKRIKEAAANNILVVLSSGNYKKASNEQTGTRADTINLITGLTLTAGALSVGGVYRDEQSGKLIASNFAFGFPQKYKNKVGVIPTPDICGVCGPQSRGVEFFVLPFPPDEQNKEGGWALNNGTSFSAPHIAGIAALIKTVLPGATPDEIKKILQLTATQAAEGNTAQGVPLSDVVHQVDGVEVRPGLANLSWAVKTAQILNYSKGNNEATTISQAVEEARLKLEN